MRVKNTVMCELLVKLGVDTAVGWGAGKTSARVNSKRGFSQYVPENLDDLELSREQHALIKKLLTHQEKVGTPVEIENDGVLPVRERDKNKVKVSAPRQVYPPGWSSYSVKERMKYWAKHPRPLPVSGVASVVVRELLKAGRAKTPRPVTKEYLLGVLKEEFPERDEVGMETNLGNLVPGRLRDIYGLSVERVRQPNGLMGFYAVPPGA